MAAPAAQKIPLFDTRAPLAPLRGRLEDKIREVLERGRYVLGPEVESFEGEFADYLGVKHVVGVGNGTDAISIALRAMGVGPGDEVVVPSFTFYASAEAIPPTGATPVFCDIDLETFCLTADTVKAALTPRTKAVLAVDLFGNPAAIPEIEALGVPLLEDAAQAAGSRFDGRKAGSLGRAATFSFYPSKNLGAFGDAGAVVTDDDEIAERVRMLRSHGSRDKITFGALGFNTRLDEIQAALIRVLLPQLDEWCEGRRRAARLYREAGIGEVVHEPKPTEGSDPAWHLYVVRSEGADALVAALNEAGIESRAYYRTPVHRQEPMSEFAQGVELPATEEAARTNLAVPIGPTLGEEEISRVVEALRTSSSA
jgi:dTDP-4-amino-4,6-dideoxygalactose transaminase